MTGALHSGECEVHVNKMLATFTALRIHLVMEKDSDSSLSFLGIHP